MSERGNCSDSELFSNMNPQYLFELFDVNGFRKRVFNGQASCSGEGYVVNKDSGSLASVLFEQQRIISFPKLLRFFNTQGDFEIPYDEGVLRFSNFDDSYEIKDVPN